MRYFSTFELEKKIKFLHVKLPGANGKIHVELAALKMSD